MRGWISCAALCAALLATPLWAQRGGGGAHGGFGGGGFGAGHGAVGGVHGGFGGHAMGFSGYRGGWRGNGWYGNRYRFWNGYPYWGWGGWGYPGWGWGGGWGYPVWYGFDDDSDNSFYASSYDGAPGYDSSYPPDYPPQYAYIPRGGSSATYASEGEVQRIQNEVEQLRARYAQRYSEPRPTPTTLIYRDGHSETVQNYGIAGNTLWIFNQDRARKVPLSQIDVPATQRDNEERGSDFVVPGTH